MSENTYGSPNIEQLYDRLRVIKEQHERSMFDDSPQDVVDFLTHSHNAIAVNICEQLLDGLPESEPEPVERFRALVLSMDSIQNWDGKEYYLGVVVEPKRVSRAMQNAAIEKREEALGVIEDRLVLEKPTDEDDADVIYICDPVSKVRHTTALGGYKKEYDEAMIEDQKQRIAEQILYEPIPDTIPRV
jgi:hypothetical protein